MLFVFVITLPVITLPVLLNALYF